MNIKPGAEHEELMVIGLARTKCVSHTHFVLASPITSEVWWKCAPPSIRVDKYNIRCEAGRIDGYRNRRGKMSILEQEIFVTGNFRIFRPQAIRVQENSANLRLEKFLSFKMNPCSINIHMEIFANLPKFAKISCTRKFAVLQYHIHILPWLIR